MRFDIISWKKFLKYHGYYIGPITMERDNELETATKQFQQDNNINVSGLLSAPNNVVDNTTDNVINKNLVDNIVDSETHGAAESLRIKEPPQFQFGPDLVYDVRECRPYFLVPIIKEDRKKEDRKNRKDKKDKKDNPEDPHQIHQIAAVKRRIKRYVGQIKQSSHGVTDVYVFSHGWRRNFYGAVTGYDRLISRYARLLHAGRLTDGTDPTTFKKNYRPLFVNIHWHSNPGQDEFIDSSGRRDKQSFMNAIAKAFEPCPLIIHAEPTNQSTAEATNAENDAATLAARETALEARFAANRIQMINDFEDLFEHFSELTAPGTDALSGDHFTPIAQDLITRLDRYDLTADDEREVGSPEDLPAKRGEKVAVAWACYHEADTRRVLVDQDQKPQDFFKGLQAWEALWKFFIATVGILALVPILQNIFKNITSHNANVIRPHADKILQFLHLKIPLSDGVLTTVAGTCLFLGYCLIGSILGAAILWGQDAIQKPRKKDSQKKEPSKGYPILMLMAWLPLQLVCTLPALLVLGTTFLFRRLTDLFPLVDERFGNRDEPGSSRMPVRIRPSLARFMLMPVKMLRKVIGQDSSVNGILDQLEGIASFYEMQQRGVETGEEAATFIADLFKEVDCLQQARVHLLGHSFGALVVANLARQLALNKEKLALKKEEQENNESATIQKIDTLCLLQGALGSGWFEGEQKLAKFVKRIGCIYSVYDTANGFIYPFANASRLAAGAVGLTYVGDRKMPKTLVTRGKFILLVKPPNLDAEKYRSKENQEISTPATVYNLDASRIIYQGAPATGGGHMDIYKDDVVNLIWALTNSS